MKLNPSQIQQLYKFTRQHYVEYYDVQTELVDHLANDIEQLWQVQPNLSFEKARDISFKKFGVFGFMDVLEARTNSLNKKYWKLVLGVFKTYFKLPQLFSTLTLFSVIYTSFSLVPNHYWVYIIILFGVFTVFGVRLFQLQKFKKQRFKQTNKKWLLEEYILKGGNIGAFGFLFFQIPMQADLHLTSIPLIIAMSTFFTCYIVLISILS